MLGSHSSAPTSIVVGTPSASCAFWLAQQTQLGHAQPDLRVDHLAQRVADDLGALLAGNLLAHAVLLISNPAIAAPGGHSWLGQC